jgi:hypothetical protein
MFDLSHLEVVVRDRLTSAGGILIVSTGQTKVLGVPCNHIHIGHHGRGGDCELSRVGQGTTSGLERARGNGPVGILRIPKEASYEPEGLDRWHARISK